MGLEEIAPYLQETMPNDLMYSDDEMIDILQESLSELKKAKLDPPAPAGKDEFPNIIPGTVFERGHVLSASKRARMLAHGKKNTIEVPIGRPESPKQVVHNASPVHITMEPSLHREAQPRNPEATHVPRSIQPMSLEERAIVPQFINNSKNSAVKQDASINANHSPNDLHLKEVDHGIEKRLSDYDNTTTFNYEVKQVQHQNRKTELERKISPAHANPNVSKKNFSSSKFYLNEVDNASSGDRVSPDEHNAVRSPPNYSPVWKPMSPSKEKIDARHAKAAHTHTSHASAVMTSVSNETGRVEKRTPPPYRPRKVSGHSSSPGPPGGAYDHYHEQADNNLENKSYKVSAHTVQDSYWDRGRRQPPPYPAEKLTPVERATIEDESMSYGVSIQPIRRKQRTLPKGVPLGNEAKYNIIEL